MLQRGAQVLLDAKACLAATAANWNSDARSCCAAEATVDLYCVAAFSHDCLTDSITRFMISLLVLGGLQSSSQSDAAFGVPPLVSSGCGLVVVE